MTAAPLPVEIEQPAPVLRLLVELPSWRSDFLENLRDFVSPRPLPPLELRSAPAPFWADVFVTRPQPWNRFLQSGVGHVIVLGLLIALTRFLALQPQVVARPSFDDSRVVYQATEYLPPLDTRSAHAARRRKADRSLSQPASSEQDSSRQPIISVPREADNHAQTIVTPPNVKLKRDVALPNIVDWSDQMQKPRLAIPPVPLTLAADTARIAPYLESSVVTPPPDAVHVAHRRNSTSLETSVVAPPPSVETASTRVVGDLNIGRSSVIAPAPQLAVSEQRSRSRSSSSGAGLGAPQAVPPPPSVSAGSSGESFGGRGRVIALNLHPAVGGPPNPPQGNRRGAFAATPEGQPAASGSPGADARGNRSGKDKENAGGSTRKGTSDLPAGLYVGSTAAKPSSVAGDAKAASTPTSSAPANSVNPNLMASLRPSRIIGVAPRGTQPESTAKLSEVERQVFGDRKFYSLSLNMPNLNSAAGSWVIRFAELGHDLKNHDSSNHDSNDRDSNNHDSNNRAANDRDANTPPGELSQPTAIRKVDPAYPLQLMRQNVGGTVILYAIIHADGTVGNVRVLRGADDRLDRFASQAVAQWQFQPAIKNGAPVDVEATFQIPFRPQRVGRDF